MRTNPFLDTLEWLFDPRLVVVILWALLIASVLIARVNWRADPLQRTGEHLTIWAMRLLIGSMWYQGSTWKLPLPYSDAFAHWLRQSGEHASFPLLADLVNRVMIPALPVVGTFVYLLEFALAASLILGLFTRFFSLVAVGQALFLWLTLYRAPHEWPWNYVFLALVHLAFVVMAAGRSLGADAVIRRRAGAGSGAGSGGVLRLVT